MLTQGAFYTSKYHSFRGESGWIWVSGQRFLFYTVGLNCFLRLSPILQPFSKQIIAAVIFLKNSTFIQCGWVKLLCRRSWELKSATQISAYGVVFVCSTLNVCPHIEWQSGVLPSTIPLAAARFIIRQWKCWLLITPRLSMWHIWSWCFCPLSWRECSYFKSDVTGGVTATVTSHPIDKTDGRRDSRRHGTKLVWAAAVPPAVCCHDRGSFYYLDECLPSLPGLTGVVLVGGRRRRSGGCLRHERMDWSGPRLCFFSVPSVHCGPGDWAYLFHWEHFLVNNRLLKGV